MAVEWIKHKGKRILYVDYSGIDNEEEMINHLYLMKKELLSTPWRIRLITNYKDAVGSHRFMDELKKMGVEYQKKIKLSATIGITGVRKLLFRAYIAFTGQDVALLNNLEDAKEYVIGRLKR